MLTVKVMSDDPDRPAWWAGCGGPAPEPAHWFG